MHAAPGFLLLLPRPYELHEIITEIESEHGLTKSVEPDGSGGLQLQVLRVFVKPGNCP